MSNIYHSGDFNFRGSSHVNQDSWSSIGKFLPPIVTRPFTSVGDAAVTVGHAIERPVVWVADKIQKVDHIVDNVLDITAHTTSQVDNILTGKSHFLMYLGIGVLVVVVLPIVLNKAL